METRMTDPKAIDISPEAVGARVAYLRSLGVAENAADLLSALSAALSEARGKVGEAERERDEARAENVWRPFNDDAPKDGVWLCVPWGPVYVSAFFGTATDVEGGETPAWRTHWDHSNLETDWGPIEEWRWRPLPSPPKDPAHD